MTFTIIFVSIYTMEGCLITVFNHVYSWHSGALNQTLQYQDLLHSLVCVPGSDLNIFFHPRAFMHYYMSWFKTSSSLEATSHLNYSILTCAA